jgi:hypothetical protein
MPDLYTVHFFGGPEHRKSMVTELLPEIRFPVMEDIKPTIRPEGLDATPSKMRCHVYRREVGTVDYVYKGVE